MLAARVPDLQPRLLSQLVGFVQALRREAIRKPPSVAESMDWARTLLLLHADVLDATLVQDTLNVLLKREADIQAVQPRLSTLLAEALAAPVAAVEGLAPPAAAVGPA